jgi:hypothetical protein
MSELYEDKVGIRLKLQLLYHYKHYEEIPICISVDLKVSGKVAWKSHAA